MTTKLAWGILGTGRIAAQFAVGLNASDRNTLVAVGSRTAQTAKEFAAIHRIPTAYPSYEALLADKSLHAIYISLPNSLHHEWTLKALRAGKHVLCEKPLATSLAQAQEMFDIARQQGRLLAEGFMYLSHPQTRAIQKAIANGRIGRLRLMRLSFLFAAAKIDGSIKFNAALAGGSLMDVGCYCISFARLLAAAEPTALSAVAHLHPSGVDEYAVGTLTFPDGLLANFASGMTLRADNTALLLGTDGYIEIPVPWKPPVTDAQHTLVDAAGARHTTRLSTGKDLYAMEADDFAATLLDGTPQTVTQAFSLGNQKCLDTLRCQIGLSC